MLLFFIFIRNEINSIPIYMQIGNTGFIFKSRLFLVCQFENEKYKVIFMFSYLMWQCVAQEHTESLISGVFPLHFGSNCLFSTKHFYFVIHHAHTKGK